MGEKCTTSAECQTIRIAESLDMDDWKTVPRPCAKVVNKWLILKRCLPLYQRVGMEVVNGDQEGLWSSKNKSVVEILMKSWLSNFFNKDIEMSY